MAKPDAPRYFNVGETIHLTSRVALPGSRTPVDPDVVVLSSLRREGVETLDGPVAFSKIATGEYALTLATADLVPGSYTLAVTHATGTSRVTISTDQFVLHPV